MFNVGDVVICIRSRHPYHATEPILNHKYIVQEYSTANSHWPLIYVEGHDYNYAAECFVKSGALTKLEKLIYGIENDK